MGAPVYKMVIRRSSKPPYGLRFRRPMERSTEGDIPLGGPGDDTIRTAGRRRRGSVPDVPRRPSVGWGGCPASAMCPPDLASPPEFAMSMAMPQSDFRATGSIGRRAGAGSGAETGRCPMGLRDDRTRRAEDGGQDEGHDQHGDMQPHRTDSPWTSRRAPHTHSRPRPRRLRSWEPRPRPSDHGNR